MKRWIIGLSGFALVAFLGFAGAQNVMEGQGALWSIRTGGVLNIESGGALQIAGSDRTSALATAPSAVAAGYKIARGEVALDGSNPTPVATGLTTIVACTVSAKKTTAPASEELTYNTSSGTLDIYAWQPTNASVTTKVASASTATVGWICIGT
jgi:hypothetical protein